MKVLFIAKPYGWYKIVKTDKEQLDRMEKKLDSLIKSEIDKGKNLEIRKVLEENEKFKS